MTTELQRYDAACRALAEARTIDEAKGLHDKAEAMRAYARQAKNRQLEVDAAEIRMRAERRLGEILVLAKGKGQVSRGQPPKNSADEEEFSRVKLSEAGIDHKLSARAQKMAALPPDSFETLIDSWRERVEADAERVTVNLLKGTEKARTRDEREAALAARIAALPERRYGVIVADPEWRFEPWSRRTGLDRAADNHYPTSLTEVIAARPVADIAAEDCVLFLWATVPMLPHALDVMEAWGFDYRSHFCWGKDRIGTGYWNRNQHELLLVGVKGDIPAPAPGTQWSSLITAPVGRHSEKPEAFLDMVEAYYPTLPKVELNRRGPPRSGWDAWGNEAGEHYDPETGEVVNEDAQRPSNRDGSAGGEPSPEAGPQAEASHAGNGCGTPADREGQSREGEGHTAEAVDRDRPAQPSPAPVDYVDHPTPAPPPQGEGSEEEGIPDFLRRDADNRLAAAAPPQTLLGRIGRAIRETVG